MIIVVINIIIVMIIIITIPTKKRDFWPFLYLEFIINIIIITITIIISTSNKFLKGLTVSRKTHQKFSC